MEGLSKKLIWQDGLWLLSMGAVPAFTHFLEEAEILLFRPLLPSCFLCLQTLKQLITPANVTQRQSSHKKSRQFTSASLLSWCPYFSAEGGSCCLPGKATPARPCTEAQRGDRSSRRQPPCADAQRAL